MFHFISNFGNGKVCQDSHGRRFFFYLTWPIKKTCFKLQTYTCITSKYYTLFVYHFHFSFHSLQDKQEVITVGCLLFIFRVYCMWHTCCGRLVKSRFLIRSNDERTRRGDHINQWLQLYFTLIPFHVPYNHHSFTFTNVIYSAVWSHTIKDTMQ